VAVKWWNIHEDNGDDVPRGLRKPGSHQKERRLWNRMMKKMSTHLKTAEESQENQRRKKREQLMAKFPGPLNLLTCVIE
jgi:50S ribosomal subunit-associated GTPase HflX